MRKVCGPSANCHVVLAVGLADLPCAILTSTMAGHARYPLIREQPDIVKSRLTTRGGDDAVRIDEV